MLRESGMCDTVHLFNTRDHNWLGAFKKDWEQPQLKKHCRPQPITYANLLFVIVA